MALIRHSMDTYLGLLLHTAHITPSGASMNRQGRVLEMVQVEGKQVNSLRMSTLVVL